jgi:phenylpropionate dioxygenase-like ring-hydroxylating dioxygenase large terminal subunit
MDAALDTLVRQRLKEEKERTSYPEAYPKLPDLPLGRYTDPAFYEQEISQLFRRSWLFAGHESELPGPQGYRALDIPFAPIVLTRDHDGTIRALRNACRHRGAPVVRDECGEARRLICQFHSWTYRLNGHLAHIPDERSFAPNIRDDRDLASVRCEVQNGYVFIALDDDVPPLSDVMGPLIRDYGELAPENLQLVNRQSYFVRCNWKLMVEAFIESYHVPTVHPATAAKTIIPGSTVFRLHPHGNSAMFNPLRPEVASGQGDGANRWNATAGLPQIDTATDFYRDNLAVIFAFPTTWATLDLVGHPILTFWPLAIDRTRMDVQWYGLPWGDGPLPREWSERVAGTDVTIHEDIANLEPMQRAVESAAHKGVPLSFAERAIWHFHREIDRKLGSVVPAQLQIDDELADFVEP